MEILFIALMAITVLSMMITTFTNYKLNGLTSILSFLTFTGCLYYCDLFLYFGLLSILRK